METDLLSPPTLIEPRTAHAGRGMAERWLASHGYVKDAWGNYKLPGRDDRRYKFGCFVLRLERRAQDGSWHRIRFGYYRRLFIRNGQLGGMTA